MSVMATLDVAGLRVLIVGGGVVARRRGEALATSGAVLTVVAPEVDDELSDAALASGGAVHRRGYRDGDVEGCGLVVAAAGDASVNARVAEDAAAAGVWCNCASDPSAGRVGFVAERRAGEVRIGVETGGASASAARDIATELAETIGQSDWVGLLDEAKAWRARVQREVPEGATRQAVLRELAGSISRERLAQGGREALTRYYESLLSDAVKAAAAPRGEVA